MGFTGFQSYTWCELYFTSIQMRLGDNSARKMKIAGESIYRYMYKDVVHCRQAILQPQRLTSAYSQISQSSRRQSLCLGPVPLRSSHNTPKQTDQQANSLSPH